MTIGREKNNNIFIAPKIEMHQSSIIFRINMAEVFLCDSLKPLKINFTNGK